MQISGRSGKKLEATKQRKAKEIEEPMAEEIVVEEPKKESESKPMYKPQLPYPQRFKKKALDEKFSKCLGTMLNYAKFIKDVMSKKKRLRDNEVVNLTEECSAILQKRLGAWKSQGDHHHIQLADRSITYPRGIVEDVLVKVDKFIFPADFVNLDMDEDEETPFIFGRPFLATARITDPLERFLVADEVLDKEED
ncbi:uncharacterized protein [Henckelia pumila]|uniref:uncharacterized protein n=1 Tax=Henckelia pumila TaxID=405737 RepID=UPI003C6E151F